MVLVVVNSYIIFVTEFGYFFSNCGYLKVEMYCFLANISRSIKDPKVFTFCNYSLFPYLDILKMRFIRRTTRVQFLHETCALYCWVRISSTTLHRDPIPIPYRYILLPATFSTVRSQRRSRTSFTYR